MHSESLDGQLQIGINELNANSARSHVLNLYAMALADLSLDHRELQLLFSVAERTGLSRNEIQEILLDPHELDTWLPNDLRGRITCLYDFARMVWSDGSVDQTERGLLERFCITFGFEPENAPSIVDFLLQEASADTSLDEVIAIAESNS